MATSASTIVAAMAAKARREVREHFEQENAFAPTDAAPYEPPSAMHRRQFEHLVGRGILRDTGRGRYWIDRDADRREQERQRAAAILAFKIILIGFAIAIAAAAILTAVH